MFSFSFCRALACFAVAGFLLAPLSHSADASWPVAGEGLQPDPAWQAGRLANGLRYVVRGNALPAGRVSYRLAVEVGGAHEQPAERGFAHVIEHMAFNGTRRFPGETLPKQFGQRGLAFGPEVSAFTFPTYTIYQFDAPGSDRANVEWMLGVLRDFADGITFDPKQLKRELGVIAAEFRDRSSPGVRLASVRSRELYPESGLGRSMHVMPTNVTAEALRKFYHQWYRPERMILAVVGDAPPEELAAAIEREFGSMAAAAGPAPAFDPQPIENPPASTESVYHDPQGGGLWIELTSIMPRTQADTRAERRRQFAANLAIQALTERLQDIVRENPKVYAGLGARLEAATPFSFEANLYASISSDAWSTALGTLTDELRRSLEFTFHSAEIEMAKTRLLQLAEQSLRGARTSESPDLAAWAIQSALWRYVLISPEDHHALAHEVLAQIDPLEVAHAWRSFWQAGRTRVFGYGFFPVAGANKLFSEVVASRSQAQLAPPAKPATIRFPYTNFGPPGELRQRRHDADTDIHLLEFTNGVRVNLKRTTFTANRVDLAAAFGAGLNSAPRDNATLAPVASSMFLQGGVRRLTPNDLQRALGAEPISLSFTAAEGAFTFAGNSTPERTELLLQVVCAYLTDPRFDSAAFASAIERLSGDFHERMRTAEGVINLRAFHEATGKDDRYRAPAPDELSKLTVEQIRDWLTPALRDAPLEVGLVGDFDPEAMIPVLARTLGAIPPRATSPAPAVPVNFLKKPQEFDFDASPFTPRAAVYMMWPADQGVTIRGSRRLEVLSTLLHNRVNQRLREDLGAAYSPEVDSWRTASGSEEGYVTAFVTTDPKLTSKVRRLLLAEADTLARRGATPAELQEAITPILLRTRLQLSGNDYWLWHIAVKAQRQPEVLGFPLTRTSEFQTITLEEINALAREVLPKSRALQFTARPFRL